MLKRKRYITLIMSSLKKQEGPKRGWNSRISNAIPCTTLVTEPPKHLAVGEVKFYYFNADMR